jgi:hypothetical protein
MSDAEKAGRTSISKSRTIEEIRDYWDAHSLSDHRDKTQEASFEVRATRRRRFPIDPDIYTAIETLVHVRGVSAETLVNLWLVEHLGKGQKPQPAERRPR